MTDTHGNTPGGPVPPTSGDEHAQHAAQTGQQPYYQQSYQQPYQAQHTPGQVTVEKKSHGLRTFLLAFAGAALACVIGLGGFFLAGDARPDIDTGAAAPWKGRNLL